MSLLTRTLTKQGSIMAMRSRGVTAMPVTQRCASTLVEVGPAAEEIAELMARSRAAQAQIADYTQEQVDDLITAMVWSVAEESTSKLIAQHTVDETRLGNYDGKFLKIFRKTRCTLMDIIDDKSVGVVEELKDLGIVKIAKPVGVVGALSPSTNPEATPVIKAISAVKGRNSIIVAPHPRAAKTNALIIELLRGACVAMGAPPDLVLGVDSPSVEKTKQLMQQCDRVLATGGTPMVLAAYSSGTPALGVGVGNAVVTVDSSADLADAANKISISKTLDFAASCSADNSLLLLEDVYDEMMENLVAKGGFVLSDEDKAKLQAVIWVDGHINAKIVAQPASVIAEMAGFSIPEGTTFFLVKETGWGPEYPFSGEKMCVTAAVYKATNMQHAIDLTKNIQAYQGSGHSAGIYSKNEENVMALAHAAHTSRIMVNQPQAPSNSGNLWNGLKQTFSLGCGSWGGNGINHNITWRDLVNYTWVSFPLATPKELTDDETMFARVKDRMANAPKPPASAFVVAK